MERRGRIAFWIVVALVLSLLAARSSSVPLIDPDEPRFARTSIEMLRSGDLVVPSYEWEPRLAKPPVFHWIQAAVFRLLGASEWSARLPSLLATLGSMLILGWATRRRFGEEGAVWAVVFFGTMPLVVAIGRLGTTDALLSVHVLAALALDVAEPEEVGPYRGAAIGALLGLAVLIKGPVGLLLPALVMLAGRTAMPGRNVLPQTRTLVAFAGALALVALPWSVAFVRRIGWDAFGEVLRGELLERYFAGTAHVEPPWYYGPVVAVGLLPWAAPLVVALLRLPGRRHDPAARTALYAGAGLVAGLLFLSLGRGKLPSYAAPLAPLAAILVTWELGRELDDPRERTLGPSLLAASLAAAGLVLLVVGGRYRLEVVQRFAFRGSALWIAGSIVAFIGVLRHRPRWVYATAAGTAWAFLMLTVVDPLPVVMEGRSARGLVRELPQLSSASRPVVVVEMQVPSLVFYLDRVTEKVRAGRLGERIDRADDPLFVFDPRDLGLVPPEVRRRLREVARHGKYRVLEKRNGDMPHFQEKKHVPNGESGARRNRPFRLTIVAGRG